MSDTLSATIFGSSPSLNKCNHSPSVSAIPSGTVSQQEFDNLCCGLYTSYSRLICGSRPATNSLSPHFRFSRLSLYATSSSGSNLPTLRKNVVLDHHTWALELAMCLALRSCRSSRISRPATSSTEACSWEVKSAVLSSQLHSPSLSSYPIAQRPVVKCKLPKTTMATTSTQPPQEGKAGPTVV